MLETGNRIIAKENVLGISTKRSLVILICFKNGRRRQKENAEDQREFENVNDDGNSTELRMWNDDGLYYASQNAGVISESELFDPYV